MKKEEVAEEGFDDLLYTKEKKQKKTKLAVTKKIGRKNMKNKKNARESLNKVRGNSLDTLDSNNSEEGADTLNTVVKKKNDTASRKKKATVWLKPRRNPTTTEQRKLFGRALELMLITCMNNHVYHFNNKFRIQKQGGPIGLKLTGEIADCLMLTVRKVKKV